MSNNGRKILIGGVVAVILAIGLAVGAIYLAPSMTTTIPGFSSSSNTGQQSTSLSSSSKVLGQSGPMNIYLTDAPPSSPQFKYLLVNVSSVVLKYQGNVSSSTPHDQWVFNVPASNGTNVNLTSLVNNKVLLGATNAPAGNVTGIILNISGAKAFFSDGSSAQLKVVANGKLMIPINFTVSATGSNDLTLDITPNSIHISQGHAEVLTPVIHATAVHTGSDSTVTVQVTTSLTDTTSGSDTSTSSSSSSSTSTTTTSTVTSETSVTSTTSTTTNSASS